MTAFNKAWGVVKARAPSMCDTCMSDELEMDTKAECIQEVLDGPLSGWEKKEEIAKIKAGPDYWGYCLQCGDEFEG
jgi:hypothetical protein